MGGAILWVGVPGWSIKKAKASRVPVDWTSASWLQTHSLVLLLPCLPCHDGLSPPTWAKGSPSFLELAWEKQVQEVTVVATIISTAMSSVADGWLLLAYFKHFIIIQTSVSSIPVPGAIASVSWSWRKFLLWNCCNLECWSLMDFLETLPWFHRRSFVLLGNCFVFKQFVTLSSSSEILNFPIYFCCHLFGNSVLWCSPGCPGTHHLAYTDFERWSSFFFNLQSAKIARLPHILFSSSMAWNKLDGCSS